MAVGDKLTVARFNSVQGRVNGVLGQTTTGYGQTLSSNQLPLSTKITVADYLNLRSDMLKARQHQTGNDESGREVLIPAANVNVSTNNLVSSNHGFTNGTKVMFAYVPFAGAGSTQPSAPGNLTYNSFYYIRNVTADEFQLSSTPTGAIIDITTQGAGTHVVFSGFPVRTTANKITEADKINLEDKAGIIEAEKFSVAENQTEAGSGTSSARNIGWNTSIVHIVTVDFSSVETARYYFNAGGEIRTRATISGTNSVLGTDWNTMLTNMGTIKMNASDTVATGSGSGSNIGYYDLTEANQQIFTKTGSGAYAANDYTVLARRDSTGRYVYLTIQFNDDKGPNPNFDELVDGITTSFVEYLRPSGSGVSVPAPTFTTTTNLQ